MRTESFLFKDVLDNMTRKTKAFFTTAVSAACLLLLTACLPDMSMLGPNNRPLDTRIAAMADAATPVSVILPFTPGLYCRIGRGAAFFNNDWYDFADTPFTLYKGAKANIRVTRLRHADTMQIQAIFDGDGQKVVFCPLTGVTPGQPVSCASLYTLEDDLKSGIKRTFDVPHAVRGGTITCAYKREFLKPISTPAAGGN
jgi:hypothetical protein